MLRKLCLLLIFLLSGVIIASQILVNQGPAISNNNTDQKIASLIKPSVVRVVEGYSIAWSYQPPYDSDPQVDAALQQYLDSMNSVTDIYASGSGAIISSDGYIVTNAHVVNYLKSGDEQLVDDTLFMMAQQLSQSFGTDDDTMFTYLKATLMPETLNTLLKVVLPGGEVIDAEIQSYGAPTGEGIDVAVIKIDKTNLPTVRLGDSSKLNLQDTITIFGYPGAADSDMFSEESTLVVTITNGRISAVDKKSTQGGPVIQVDAAATHGNSGGPVIDQNGRLIGLLTFRSEKNQNEVQGFNFAVPVNTVKDFVKEAGAKNTEASYDKAYRDGLDLYWSGYYDEALKKFQTVQKLCPDNPDVKKLMSDAKGKVSQSKMLWSNYSDTVFIVDIACGALILLLLVVFIVSTVKASKRKKAQQPQVIYIQANTPNTASPPNAWSQNVPPPNNSYPINNQMNNAPNNYQRNNYPQGSNQPAAPIPGNPSFGNQSLNYAADNYQANINTTNVNSHPNPGVIARLYEVSGPHRNLCVTFETQPVIIGRDPRSCTIVFPQEYSGVARVHCQITYDRQRKLFTLKDLSSYTGTFLKSGERLDAGEERLLKSGDGFYVSSTDILFEVRLD